MGAVNRLSSYFRGVVLKRLSAVEADAASSNQHEINGTVSIKHVLGPDRRIFKAQFLYLSDNEDEQASTEGSLTWYDARQRNPNRSEWRLYFPNNEVYERASVGDLLVIARRPDDGLLVVVATGGSTAENQLIALFGYRDKQTGGFSIRNISEEDEELTLTAKLLLEHLGVDLADTADDLLEDMLQRWNGAFPRTAEFSTYARSSARPVLLADDADAALLTWIECEEVLFRTLERHIVEQRLQAGIEDVDEFVRFSLSVQNRRKSRAGHALENHLEHIFRSLGIPFSRGQVTENRSRPDFLFPGIDAYRDPDFPASLLVMLGVKSSCKDRWRQILSEAQRIRQKHLMTLEPGISETQTFEMRSSMVQLVVPRDLHATFSTAQQEWLMSLQDFIIERQSSAAALCR